MLTVDDIAARYKVDRRTVTDRWTKRPDFPPPIVRINRRMRWWAEADVEAWARGEKREKRAA